MTSSERQLHALQRENQQLRRAVEELSILNDLATAIGAAQEVQEIMQIIIRRSLRAVKAEQGNITPIDPEEMTQQQTLVRTISNTQMQTAFHVNAALVGWMQNYKKPLILNSPHEDERFKHARWDSAVRSLLCVPMIVHNQLTGLLTLYNKKDADGFTNEDQRLLSILAGQSAQILENTRLVEEERKLHLMQAELNLANEIQMNLLPKLVPDLPGYDIAGTSIPAQTVGGDYFDYIPMAQDQLALCVGDVSGKGMPAAMMMATLQATLRNQALSGMSVTESIAQSNRYVCEHTHRKTFITLFYGVLDPESGAFEYVNAGHNRPYLLRAGGKPEELPGGGLVLGFRPTQTYTSHTLQLNHGDMLVIYSDGITEAMNDAREQFDEETLENVIAHYADADAETLVRRIIDAVRYHAGDTPQSDDMTLLVVRRTS